MLVLRTLCPADYQEVLAHSFTSYKDVLRLARAASKAGLDQLHSESSLTRRDALAGIGGQDTQFDVLLLAQRQADYVLAGRRTSDLMFKFVPNE